MIPTKVFIHYLDQLKQLLVKIESHDKDLSCERLYFNMFPLLQQAKTAISFSLRCSCPLAGKEIISFGDEDYTFESVFAEIERTKNYLLSVPDVEFRHMEIAKVSTAAGFADLKFDGADYFIMYSLPNFFFHYSMVYAIARQAGVEIGKADFDGFHKYPRGFTFTDECD